MRVITAGIVLSAVVACSTRPALAASDAARESAQLSLEWLASVMDQYHDHLGVYRDSGSPDNHFHARAKIPDGSAAAAMEEAWAAAPYSGATSIRCTFDAVTPTHFAGFYFLNGLLPPGATVPLPNFGETCEAGMNGGGAVQLTFWTQGESGGEVVEFFVAGVGRDPVSGDAVAECPDSSPRHPAIGTKTVLTTDWRQQSIDLTGLDLGYLLGGFGWVANAVDNPSGAVFHLDDIRLELGDARKVQRLAEPRLLQSFEVLPVQPDVSDPDTRDDFDLVLRSVAFTYDNAVALLAFLAGGTEDGLRRARLIGDALVHAATHDRAFDDGRLRDAYAAGDHALPPGWTPNGRTNTAPVPGFLVGDGFFEVYQQGLSAGNLAWAMIALLALHERTCDLDYLVAAERLGGVIRSFHEGSGTYPAFRGGIDNPECPAEGSPECPSPTLRVYASTEHGLDIVAAFTRIAKLTGDASWDSDAALAAAFVEATWDPEQGCYLAGTLDPDTLNALPGQLPLDVQAWSLLALPPGARHVEAVACANEHHAVEHDGFSGYDFNDADGIEDGRGVWFEGTAHVATALTFNNDDAGAEVLRAELRRAQTVAGFGDGGGLVAACHDGVSSGFGFDLYKRRHVGATAWNVLAQLRVNPFDGTVAGACPGDCDGDARTTVADLLAGIGILLQRPERCATQCRALDADGDGRVSVRELVLAIKLAVDGDCFGT